MFRGFVVGVNSYFSGEVSERRPWAYKRERRPKGFQIDSAFPPIPASEAGPISLAKQGEGVIGGMNVDTRVDPRGLTYYWLNFHRSDRQQSPGTDYSAMRAGRVVVTPLRYDRTDEDAFNDLAQKLPKFEG